MGVRRHVILVVEDDADLRRLYRTALTLDGFDVDEAADGLDALRRIDYRRPDLVVLDIGLPALSGVAVQQEIAAQAYTSRIPVVIVTGTALNLDHLDVACVLRKPVEPSELLKTVRSCLAAAAPDVS
jgi:two-component system response regulator MprA